jgi:RNA polymerase sigma-70 factor (ECF subfamily)
MLNNTTLCKDALQDIFLKILLNISNFNFKSKFSTWIYSITYNHCIDVIRKEGKLISNEKDIEEDHKLITKVDEIEEKMLLQIKVKRLEEILDSIPVSDKAILLLKYQGGMSIKEISDILAKSESAVKMKLKRAKEKCLKKYSELYNNQPI